MVHRPLPEDDDDGLISTHTHHNKTNPTIVTACCPDVARGAHVSSILRERVKNHPNLFNCVEEYTESRAMLPPCAALRYTYAPGSLIPLVGGLLPLPSTDSVRPFRSTGTFFNLFDSMLFFLHAVTASHSANVFPLVLTRDNLRVHTDTLVPCLDFGAHIVPCIVGSDSDSGSGPGSVFARVAATMPYSVFMSPDMIMLKYIYCNDIATVTKSDVSAVSTIAHTVYATALPLPFRSTDMLDNVSDYLVDHYLHLSASAAIQYNAENPCKFAVHSVLATYLQLISELFRSGDTCILETFVGPINRFLSPRHFTRTDDVFDAIHTAFYETALRDDAFFDMVG